MTEAPLIETERLSLRGHRALDFSDSAAMWADASVTRYIGGRPFSPTEVWSRLLRHYGHWALLGFGYWVVRERSSNRFVGEVGFFDLKRHSEPGLVGVPEIGWALATWARGQGFATESVRAAVDWADARLESSKTFCAITPANTASIRVASKCGYVPAGQAVIDGDPVLIFERAARPKAG